MERESPAAFDRLSILMPPAHMRALEKATVAVFGLGGVGAAACSALARSAVGNFILVDFDSVQESNLNRLLIASRADIGKKKTHLMKEHILSVNPEARVEIYEDFLDEENYTRIMENRKPDFCIEAIDSLLPKVQTIRKLLLNSVPFASSMGAGGRLNPLAVKTGPLSQVTTCTLASRVKKYLKKDGVDLRRIKTVYSTEQGVKPRPPAGEAEAYRGRLRGDQGSAMPVPVTFGMTLAWLALSRIARKAQSQS